MKRNINKFTLYLLPIIYIALTLYFALGLQTWQMAVGLAIFIIGVLIGKRLNVKTTVKRNGEKIYYERHPAIFAIWVVAIVARVSVEFFFKTGTTIFIVTCLLALVTGMIISESKFVRLRLKEGKMEL
ncbi:MAG: DUF1453 family protein [Candidatus Micrarchaeota archaeon]|nr:DUF1453 family protein [Candidatus Micrarchaeota archaeon]